MNFAASLAAFALIVLFACPSQAAAQAPAAASVYGRLDPIFADYQRRNHKLPLALRARDR